MAVLQCGRMGQCSRDKRLVAERVADKLLYRSNLALRIAVALSLGMVLTLCADG